jgi:nucleoid DNA-binding protein
MTNREFLNTRISDMTAVEKNDAIVMAKNLLDIVLKNCNETEKEKILNSFGTYEVPARLLK